MHAMEKHKGDKYIYLLCKNTKHKGVSFPPLTGKGYFLSVAVHIVVKLQHKLLTSMGCHREYYTGILKL